VRSHDGNGQTSLDQMVSQLNKKQPIKFTSSVPRGNPQYQLAGNKIPT
jgi:hypothetical protein